MSGPTPSKGKEKRKRKDPPASDAAQGQDSNQEKCTTTPSNQPITTRQHQSGDSGPINVRSSESEKRHRISTRGDTWENPLPVSSGSGGRPTVTMPKAEGVNETAKTLQYDLPRGDGGAQGRGTSRNTGSAPSAKKKAKKLKQEKNEAPQKNRKTTKNAEWTTPEWTTVFDVCKKHPDGLEQWEYPRNAVCLGIIQRIVILACNLNNATHQTKPDGVVQKWNENFPEYPKYQSPNGHAEFEIWVCALRATLLKLVPGGDYPSGGGSDIIRENRKKHVDRFFQALRPTVQRLLRNGGYNGKKGHIDASQFPPGFSLTFSAV